MAWWTERSRIIIMRAMKDFSLASDFPPASEADWRATVAKALGSAPFQTLETPVYEGFRTEPLYTRRREAPAIFGNRSWSIIQPLIGEKQFAEELTGGASAFSIAFDACPGLEIKDDLEPLVGFTNEPFYIAPGSSVADAALLLASKSDNKLAGSGGFDLSQLSRFQANVPLTNPRSLPITSTRPSTFMSTRRHLCRSSQAAMPGTAREGRLLKSWASHWPQAWPIGAPSLRRACRFPRPRDASDFRSRRHRTSSSRSQRSAPCGFSGRERSPRQEKIRTQICFSSPKCRLAFSPPTIRM